MPKGAQFRLYSSQYLGTNSSAAANSEAVKAEAEAKGRDGAVPLASRGLYRNATPSATVPGLFVISLPTTDVGFSIVEVRLRDASAIPLHGRGELGCCRHIRCRADTSDIEDWLLTPAPTPALPGLPVRVSACPSGSARLGLAGGEPIPPQGGPGGVRHKGPESLSGREMLLRRAVRAHPAFFVHPHTRVHPR